MPIARLPIARLPTARHLALTWSIPDQYGGMTTALFERSRAFKAHGGAAVDVLTFDNRVDYPARLTTLRELGAVSPGTTVLNLWDWLRERELPPRASRGTGLFTPLSINDGFSTAERDGRVLTRTRVAADGSTELQTDYYREDGSLLASDRRDCREEGVRGGRSVVLCDPAGRPTVHFSRITPLYHAWVDAVAGADDSIIIVDSKTVANLFVDYRRPRTLTIHIVHGSHSADPGNPRSGFSPLRAAALERADRFDAVVLLTARQKRELRRVLDPARNLAVIPNQLTGEADAGATRVATRGIMMASLTVRKRVDHAITAVARAQQRASSQLTLDIYGDGPLRPGLAAVADDLAAPGSVRLHGHLPHARRQLPAASFLLLTSTSEGFPLVLLEAMQNGCLPIAYDIRYGPAELIRDGVNGFLVPDGDVEALADAITRLRSLPDAAVARMRKRAQRTAARYSASATTRRWGARMRHLRRRQSTRRLLGTVKRALRSVRARIVRRRL
ncbi:glycosyltransferase [Salinibacterium sp. ZJ450]|uniref:glycosyltransferase n=1 Tax=Salinibacterium sp. ZJ450 TaxID=2708338 RepID=UPI001421EA03|nr:glycosyltransferase [Salinibacterium sp. ZJ450]